MSKTQGWIALALLAALVTVVVVNATGPTDAEEWARKREAMLEDARYELLMLNLSRRSYQASIDLAKSRIENGTLDRKDIDSAVSQAQEKYHKALADPKIAELRRLGLVDD